MARFRITSLVILVGGIAAGLGAMRASSDMAEKVVRTVVFFVLLLGLTGALVRRSGSWIGFAAFAWGYLTILVAVFSNDPDLTQVAIEAVADRLHPTDFEQPPRPKVNAKHLDTLEDPPSRYNIPGKLDVSKIDCDIEAPELTSSERLLMKGYQERLRDHQERYQKATERNNNNAEAIDIYCATLALGWVGAILGRILEKPRAPATG